jgi:hypothetical protein
MGGGGTLPPELMAKVMGALSARTQGGAGGAAGPTPGRDLGERLAEVQGADPSMVLRQLEQVNQVLGVLFVKTFQSLPNVANQISATMKQLSRAVKEAQQASNVSETVSGATGQPGQPPPISFSAAQAGENAGPPSYAGAA